MHVLLRWERNKEKQNKNQFSNLFNTKIDQTKEVFLITTMQESSFWVLIEGQEYSTAKKLLKPM